MTELATLIESMCQGTATHADRDRLEKLLRDPANRAGYLAAKRLHSELLWRWHRGRFKVLGPQHAAGAPRRHAVKVGSASADAQPRASRGSAAAFAGVVVGWLSRQAIALSKPVPMALLVAGGMVAGLLGIAAIVSVPPPSVSDDAAPRWPDAQITGVHDAKWRSASASFGLTDPLYAGTTLDLERGLVEIRYEGGAIVVLEGPAELRVEGRSAARLFRGRLTAKLKKKDSATARHAGAELPRLFTIHTPKASVHDLGTEFGVDVRAAGDADVHVFDGLVELASVGGNASASDAAAFRLAAGDAAQIDEAGRITSTGGGQAKKFIRAMPKVKPQQQEQPAVWSDAIAESIYRDDFSGTGPLHGTTPASRQGVGTVAWTVTPQSWGEMETKDGSPRLTIAGGGVASLPFVPEPGHLYRLSVVVDVTAGAHKWAAAGFIDPAALLTEDDPFNYAWFGQRQVNSPGLAPPYDFNMHVAGPSRNARLRGDPFVGEQRRAIIIDTSTPRWNVQFLVGGRVVGRHVYAANPTGIQRVGIGSDGAETRATFRSFVLERNVVPPLTDEPAVAARQREIDQ